MGKDAALLEEREAVSLIQENPRVMVRPVLTDGVSAVAGFDAAAYAALLGRPGPRSGESSGRRRA
jgi:arsenate reductase-like glutaredoxin family protein